MIIVIVYSWLDVVLWKPRIKIKRKHFFLVEKGSEVTPTIQNITWQENARGTFMVLRGQTVKLFRSRFYKCTNWAMCTCLCTHSRKFAILMKVIVKPIQFTLLTLIFPNKKATGCIAHKKSVWTISLAFNSLITMVLYRKSMACLRLVVRQDSRCQKDTFTHNIIIFHS